MDRNKLFMLFCAGALVAVVMIVVIEHYMKEMDRVPAVAKQQAGQPSVTAVPASMQVEEHVQILDYEYNKQTGEKQFLR